MSNKADLVGGQVPYAQTPHLTSDVTIYVDVSTGDDSNPGTEQAPFKTIQAALNSLPKDLGKYSATIQVAEGEYLEDVVISGFYGGTISFGIYLKGSSSLDETRHINTLQIIGNASLIQSSGFYITGKKSGFSVGVDASDSYLFLAKVKNVAEDATAGVLIGGWGAATSSLNGVQIEGYQYGLVAAHGSLADVNAGSITNCSVGVQSGYLGSQTNAIIFLNPGITFSGNSVDTAKLHSSQIFTEELA